MNTIQPTINHHISILCSHLPLLRAFQEHLVDTPESAKLSNPAARLAESLTNMVHLQIESRRNQKTMIETNLTSLLEDQGNTPITFPKDNISKKWQEFHGSNYWDTLLEPLHPSLRHELIKYGEFAQATYDAFDLNPYSDYFGSCRYNKSNLFEQLNLTRHGYNVTKYIYTMSRTDLPQWLEKSQVSENWSSHSNWMGFIGVSDDQETQRIGRRDIVAAWRGTVLVSEWYEDFQRKMENFGHGDAKVEEGFLSIYTSNFGYNQPSASEQVMKELARLIQLYRKRGEQVSLTVTGISSIDKFQCCEGCLNK